MMQPALRTPRLELRPMTLADAPRVAALSSDLRIARMVSSLPFPNPVGNVEAFVARRPLIEAEGGGVWAICDSEGVQGAIGLHANPLRRAEAELGYWLAVAVWGRGYATEAGRAVIAEGFARGGSGEGCAEITAGRFPDNPASGAVLRKLGFRETGARKPTFCRARGEEVETIRLILHPPAREAPHGLPS